MADLQESDAHLNDREPRKGGSTVGCGASRVTGGTGPVGDSQLHDKQPPETERTS